MCANSDEPQPSSNTQLNVALISCDGVLICINLSCGNIHEVTWEDLCSRAFRRTWGNIYSTLKCKYPEVTRWRYCIIQDIMCPGVCVYWYGVTRSPSGGPGGRGHIGAVCRWAGVGHPSGVFIHSARACVCKWPCLYSSSVLSAGTFQPLILMRYQRFNYARTDWLQPKHCQSKRQFVRPLLVHLSFYRLNVSN